MRNIQQFKRGDYNILVATDVAAREFMEGLSWLSITMYRLNWTVTSTASDVPAAQARMDVPFHW